MPVGQKTDQTMQRCVSVVCVELHGYEVAPCCRLAVCQGLSGGIQWPSLQ